MSTDLHKAVMTEFNAIEPVVPHLIFLEEFVPDSVIEGQLSKILMFSERLVWISDFMDLSKLLEEYRPNLDHDYNMVNKHYPQLKEGGVELYNSFLSVKDSIASTVNIMLKNDTSFGTVKNIKSVLKKLMDNYISYLVTLRSIVYVIENEELNKDFKILVEAHNGK